MNAFQSLDTAEKRVQACYDGAWGFACLAVGHVFALAYLTNHRAPPATWFTAEKWVIVGSNIAGLLLTVSFFFLMRWTRSPWFAGVLLIWAIVGLWPRLSYALYGWAALAPIPIFAFYCGILAMRGSLALARRG